VNPDQKAIFDKAVEGQRRDRLNVLHDFANNHSANVGTPCAAAIGIEPEFEGPQSNEFFHGSMATNIPPRRKFVEGGEKDIEDLIETRAHVLHAEFLALLNFGILTQPLEEGDRHVLYMTYQPFPCAACAKAIAHAGIKKVIGTDEAFPSKRWEGRIEKGRRILDAYGIEMIQTSMKLGPLDDETS